MGTNVYIKHTDFSGSVIETHLGKFSAGWRFLVNGYTTRISTEDDFYFYLNCVRHNDAAYLVNEYGTRYHPDDLIEEVLSRKDLKEHEEGNIIHSGPIDILLDVEEFC